MSKNFKVNIDKHGLYNIDIYASEHSVLVFTDIIILIEDVLYTIFEVDYKNKVLDKTISIEQYRTVLLKMLHTINNLNIIVKDDIILRVICNNRSQIDLTKEILDSIY